MSSRRMIQILFRKEMKDIFRDRKSVLMMFFVPVVLYPLIFLVAFFVISMMQTGGGVQTYRVVLDGVPDSRLESELTELQQEDRKNGGKYQLAFFDKSDFDAIVTEYYLGETEDDAERPDVAIIGGADAPTAEFLVTELTGKDLASVITDILKAELIDVYLCYQGGEYHLYYNSSVTNSNSCSRLVEVALDEVKQTLIREDLKEKGFDAEQILNPITTEETDTATSEQSLGSFLGTIIPFMMIISLLVGVFTPAIDATTGEKERGTLETLLMMPVSNSQIIVAKFLSVSLVGLITTLLSVASMAGLGAYMLTMISKTGAVNFGGINVGTFLPAILITLPVLIVLSLFLTAISMCVTCFAKTYKEANTYMSPVMIIVMLTGYIGFIPNIDFDRTVAMIPVANVCLLIKNLLLFKVNIELVLLVIASTAVYTGLVILLLGKMYRSEAILFDEGTHGLALLERRSNMKKGGVPTSSDGWFVALVGFLLLVFVGGLLQTDFGLEGVAASQVLLVAFPTAMAVYTRKSLKKTFSLRLPRLMTGRDERETAKEAEEGSRSMSSFGGSGRVRAWAGSLIFGIGAILLGIVIAILMTSTFSQEGEAFSTAISEMFDRPPLYVWLIAAAMPAICEELLFRGYILSAFRERYPEWGAILGVGVFFGIYHTSLMRFPSTALLGCAFAYLACRTGSILPGMILHCLNNSIAVGSIFFPEWMGRYLPFLDDNMSTATLLATAGGGLVLLAVGVFLLKKPVKKNT